MSAISGLDQALWNLKGRALGVPIWELLGGQVRQHVQAYAWIGGDRPDQVAEAAAQRRAQGSSAVKMNATAERGWLDQPAALDGVMERVLAAQAQGLDVALDFHGCVYRPMARQLLRLLESLRLLFVEEPLLSEHPEALRDLAGHGGTPIAPGEWPYSRWDFKGFLAGGEVDIIQPDLSHASGLSEVRKIAGMAEAYDVAVAPHCPLGPLALASCLQLAGCTPNVVLQELSLDMHYNQSHDLLSFVLNKEVLTPVGGLLTIPRGPGLGVEINEAAVRSAHRERHRWRNPMWRGFDGSVNEW